VVFSKFEPIRVVEGIPENLDWECDGEDFDFGEDFDKEGRILTLEFKDFFLVTAYIPSAGK
jgi:exonuclease III